MVDLTKSITSHGLFPYTVCVQLFISIFKRHWIMVILTWSENQNCPLFFFFFAHLTPNLGYILWTRNTECRFQPRRSQKRGWCYIVVSNPAEVTLYCRCIDTRLKDGIPDICWVRGIVKCALDLTGGLGKHAWQWSYGFVRVGNVFPGWLNISTNYIATYSCLYKESLVHNSLTSGSTFKDLITFILLVARRFHVCYTAVKGP
jgi:hypothetical protein